MSRAPSGFAYDIRKSGAVVITHRGRIATTLRGAVGARFLADVRDGDGQELMARLTGEYKRGNERISKEHPRNRGGDLSERCR